MSEVKLSKGFSRRDVPAGATGEGERPGCKAPILVVDDEVEILAVLTEQLSRNYEVLACDSPEEALEILRTRDVAAVVSDQRMPGLSGAELLAEAARTHPAAARILLTGYSDLEAVVEAVNRGQVYFYLSKPWRIAELETVVSRGVERWRLVRANEDLVRRLQEAKALLEARVAKRTEELESRNAELEKANEVIARLARTDQLTGLANRRVLDEVLHREAERARRESKPLAAVAFDLDHFKRVNDTWGHGTGDRLLAAVGEVLRGSVRPYDLTVRMGGEELLLLLPGAALDVAGRVAERLRARIGNLVVEGLPERVTVSAGVTVLASGETGGAFLARADAALYEAKRAGRDRIVCVGPEADPGPRTAS